MFKYELDQTIWYLLDNRIHSAPVLSRCCVENKHDDWSCNKEQKDVFCMWGKSKTVYATCDGTFDEKNVFASKSDLILFLQEE